MLPLPASVTVENAVVTLNTLSQALRGESAPEVVVDASALRHFDSSALAVLLGCERQAGAAGKRFALRGLPAQLSSLATLYGVDSLLQGA